MSGLISDVAPIATLAVFAREMLGHGPLRFVAPSSLAQSSSTPLGSLALVCAGGPVELLTPRTIAPRRTLTHHGGAGACDAAFSLDGAVYASGGADGALVVVDVDSAGAPRERRLSGRGWVELVAVSGDGAHIAFVRGREVTVVESATFAIVGTHALPATPTALAFFGRVLAAAVYGGIHVWSDGGVGRERHYPTKKALLSLAQSPDGKVFAAGAQDATVHCFRRSSGEDFAMSGYGHKVRPLAFSPDSRFLATGGSETITVWDFAGSGPEGSTPRELVGHAKSIAALAWASPRRLWSVGDDGAVILWDLARPRGGAAVAVYAHDAPAVCLAPLRADGPDAAHVAFADGALFTLFSP
jgi:WD40 repeat protein